MNILRTLSRYLIGILFTFSGYVKAVDPFGSAIKFTDYFEAFHLEFLVPLAFVCAILLSALELTLGLCLLFKVRMKIMSIGVLLFMTFFTILTFFLAIFNPVSDCGCFGDAIKLSNWGTFFKNLCFMPFVLIIFMQRKQYSPFSTCKFEWAVTVLLFAFSIGIGVYTYRHLPLIDFMAYKVGNNIPEQMSIPEGAPEDVYEATLIYEKDGEKKNFTLQDLPGEGSGWTYVDMKSTLISKGYEPPIKDFSITSIEGETLTDSILSINRYVLFYVAPTLEDASVKNIDKIKALAQYCQQNQYGFMGLTSSTDDRINDFVQKTGLAIEYNHTDATPLKSIVRSNPGLVLINNGTVVRKWHYNDFPTVENAKTVLDNDPELVIKERKNTERYSNIGIAICVLCFYVIVYFFRPKKCTSKSIIR